VYGAIHGQRTMCHVVIFECGTYTGQEVGEGVMRCLQQGFHLVLSFWVTVRRSLEGIDVV